MATKLFFTLTLTLLLLTSSLQHECVHDKMDHDFKIAGPEYQVYEQPEGRFLASYNNINILLDFSSFTGVSSDVQNYIQNSVMPPVINYLQSTISVPVRTSKLKAGGYSSLCSGAVTVPSIYNNPGVNYDLVVFVKAKNDSSASYVASGSACLLDPTTNRPTFGMITFNLANLDISATDADRESDITTTMHELTHVLGFSSSLFAYYIDPSTDATLTGHTSTKTINGYATTILNLPTLTSLIREHFNCATLPGAYMENQGGLGSAGSHFERRVFYNEYMTASTIIDQRVTKFTLALLEGTGWYKVDYSKAEAMTWGLNEGCNFYQGACVNTTTKQPNFDEFCPSLLSRGCSHTYRAGASCGAFSLTTSSSLPSAINWWGNKTVSGDSFSDNCPIMLPYSNLDCENSNNAAKATIAAETFGYGSKCFMGTLYPKGKLTSSFPYCFKSTCKLNDVGNYFVQLTVGSTVVNCTSAGSVTVSGYGGVLTCPDPNNFCEQNTVEGNCRRGCSARGTCIQNQCVCVEGWSGYDCSKQNYLDNCAKCAGNDPFRTTCYGDSCVCNPSNTTCMCALGLLSGSACPSSDSSSSDSTTENGSITLSISEDVTDTTENGSIELTVNETSTNSTENGSIEVTVNETSTNSTENGSIEITVNETSTNSTENGSIEITVNETSTNSTENGSIEITVNETSTNSTENGSIEITVNETSTNSTENGSIEITVNETSTNSTENGSIEITVNETSTNSTENGSIEITVNETSTNSTENGSIEITVNETSTNTTENGSIEIVVNETSSDSSDSTENGSIEISINETSSDSSDSTENGSIEITLNETSTNTTENGSIEITVNETSSGSSGSNSTTENGSIEVTVNETSSSESDSTEDNGSIVITMSEATSSSDSTTENGNLTIALDNSTDSTDTDTSVTENDSLDITIVNGVVTAITASRNGTSTIVLNVTTSGDVLVSGANGGNDSSSGSSSSKSYKNMIIAIVLGVVGGIFAITVAVLIIRKIRAIPSAAKQLTRQPSKKISIPAAPNTPERLTIPKRFLEEHSITKEFNFHDTEGKNLSHRSLGESPLMTGSNQGSPVRQYRKSRFRNYSPDRDRVGLDVELKDSPGKSSFCPKPDAHEGGHDSDHENHVINLDEVMTDLDSPELKVKKDKKAAKSRFANEC